MFRHYSVQFNAVTVTVAQDLFEVVASATKPFLITGYEIGQTSDVGDAGEEILRVQIIRGHTTSGTGGTAVTPTPLDPSDTAFGGTAEANNNTTIASAGTTVTLHNGLWNVRLPYVWQPIPEQFVVVAANTRVVLRLPSAPADSLTVSGTIWISEIG